MTDERVRELFAFEETQAELYNRAVGFQDLRKLALERAAVLKELLTLREAIRDVLGICDGGPLDDIDERLRKTGLLPRGERKDA